MKKINKIFLFLPLLAILAGCEEGDVYSGSPIDNPDLTITPITAVISTVPENAATDGIFLTDQKIPIKITLPRTFADTVQVEATSLAGNGRRRRAYVEIMPNQISGVGDIQSAGGDLYDNTFTLEATAIELYTVEPGLHYLLNSNVLTINTGNTTVPDNDVTKLQIKLVWPNSGTTQNLLRLNIDRPDPVLDANPTLTSGTIRIHNISATENTGSNSNGGSYNPGEYILKINAQRLISSPMNLPYRLVINFPNDTVQVFQGVYENVTTTSPFLPIAKIIKTVDSDGNISFTAEQL